MTGYQLINNKNNNYNKDKCCNKYNYSHWVRPIQRTSLFRNLMRMKNELVTIRVVLMWLEKKFRQKKSIVNNEFNDHHYVVIIIIIFFFWCYYYNYCYQGNIYSYYYFVIIITILVVILILIFLLLLVSIIMGFVHIKKNIIIIRTSSSYHHYYYYYYHYNLLLVTHMSNIIKRFINRNEAIYDRSCLKTIDCNLSRTKIDHYFNKAKPRSVIVSPKATSIDPNFHYQIWNHSH